MREADIPEGKIITQSKLVYKLKLHADGSLDKCKARLIAEGLIVREPRVSNFSLSPQTVR